MDSISYVEKSSVVRLYKHVHEDDSFAYKRIFNPAQTWLTSKVPYSASPTFFVIFAFLFEVVPFFVLFFGYKSTMVDFELDIPKWFYII